NRYTCGVGLGFLGYLLHPHGQSVVKVQFTLLTVPEYFYSFRLNESHNIFVNIVVFPLLFFVLFFQPR
ncbi:MAG TPA: hypothetical protein V6D09_26840, partial [Leptolyngbyaceae cyanobacterium]